MKNIERESPEFTDLFGPLGGFFDDLYQHTGSNEKRSQVKFSTKFVIGVFDGKKIVYELTAPDDLTDDELNDMLPEEFHMATKGETEEEIESIKKRVNEHK